MAPTLYDILGCGRTCTTGQILAEYRARVIDVHPDKVTDNEKAVSESRFHELQMAKEILCDTQTRKHYDIFLDMGESFGISFEEWMKNQTSLQQTLHWAQPGDQTLMIQQSKNALGSQTGPSSCKSEHSVNQYPRRFNGWTSHTSPIITAFRNYKI